MKSDFDFEDHRLSQQMMIRILITIVEIAIIIFVSYAITHYGMETMQVSGNSMSPNLVNSDRVLINKMSYKLHKIHRNDVVVVQENGSEHSYYTLERVIGLPGETVKIQDGQVYINGKQLKEKMDFPVMENGGLALEEIVLEDNEYFMLGDNRNECEDSRNANIGNVLKDDIVGKAWFRMNSVAVIKHIDNIQQNKNEVSSEE